MPNVPPGRGATRTDHAGWLAALSALFVRSVNQTDAHAAAARVAAERRADPALTQERLVKRIIGRASKQTAMIGAATAGAATLPGVGTAVALTVGVAADMAASVKVQTVMVLEIAAARGVRLHEDELKRATLVAAGLATVGTALANQLTAHSYRAAQAAALRVASRSAGRLALRAVPLVGVLAASGGNVLSTQLIGRRADAYFRYLAADAVEPAPLKRTTTSSSGALNAAPSKPITV